jgi:hypothetical protein
MYRRCAPSAAETGRASLGVQSSVLGRATLITLTDRTRLARPPITCASCAENACLTGLNAVSEQGQVRVVEVALPRFDLIVGQADSAESRFYSPYCVRVPRQFVRYVVDDDAVGGAFGGDELEAEPGYGETTVVLRRPRAELERGRVRRRYARSGRRRVSSRQLDICG